MSTTTTTTTTTSATATHQPVPVPAPDPGSTSQAATARRYAAALNARDIDGIAAAIHPDFVDRHVPAEIPPGPEGVALWWQILAAAFTLEVTIEDLVEAGDRVATRCTLRGTHIGEFAGVPATGRELEVSMLSMERFAEGRIVER